MKIIGKLTEFLCTLLRLTYYLVVVLVVVHVSNGINTNYMMVKFITLNYLFDGIKHKIMNIQFKNSQKISFENV